jgi:tetratricopeptide (TPR) repeat protein
MDAPEVNPGSVHGDGNIVVGRDLNARDIYIGVRQSPEPPKRLASIRFPPLRDKFTGRREILNEIVRELQHGGATVLFQRAALRADGGVGKTALAVELGWRLFEEEKFDFVFFLNSSSPQLLHSDLASLCAADQLNLPEQTAVGQELRYEGVLAWLKSPQNASRTLLILDGVDSSEAREAVRQLHPRLPGCSWLVTSRERVGGNIAERELDLFTRDEAREFLRMRLNLQQSQETDAAIDSITESVDHLPLALEIVASYLRETRQTPQMWLQEWQNAPAGTLVHHNPADTSYAVSLSRVWEQSVARISHEARAHLYAFAWFAPRPAGFPVGPIRKLELWEDFRVLLSELDRASLIQWTQAGDNFSFHRVFQAVMHHCMTDEEKNGSLGLAVSILTAVMPFPDYDVKGWQLWERLAPHYDFLLKNLAKFQAEDTAVPLIYNYGHWLFLRSRYQEAEPLLRRALAIEERRYGREHPSVNMRANNLAQLLSVTNRMEEAEPLMRRVLEVAEKLFGGEHSNVASSLGNLALLLGRKNRLGEAESLLKRALSIDEKCHGKDHPNVARDLNNLSHLLLQTNRLSEAEPLVRRALEIDERCYGKDHPEVAVELNGLARLLKEAGRLKEAEALMRRALEIDESCYGNTHPDVARDLSNLAQLLLALNRPKEAEPLMRTMLEVLENIHGREHPDVATGLNNLAQLLQETNRLSEAEPLLRQALVIAESSFGKEHPDVAIKLNNLALLLQRRDRLTGAKEMMLQALKIFLRAQVQCGHELRETSAVCRNYHRLLRQMKWSERRIQKHFRDLSEKIR